MDLLASDLAGFLDYWELLIISDFIALLFMQLINCSFCHLFTFLKLHLFTLTHRSCILSSVLSLLILNNYSVEKENYSIVSFIQCLKQPCAACAHFLLFSIIFSIKQRPSLHRQFLYYGYFFCISYIIF